jgi:uncharacterized protein YjbJ (UPF0337 family)
VQSSFQRRQQDEAKYRTENEIAGKVHEVKGKIKEKVGQLTNDPDLEAEGIGEKIAVQSKRKSAIEESPRKIVWTAPLGASRRRLKYI